VFRADDEEIHMATMDLRRLDATGFEFGETRTGARRLARERAHASTPEQQVQASLPAAPLPVSRSPMLFDLSTVNWLEDEASASGKQRQLLAHPPWPTAARDDAPGSQWLARLACGVACAALAMAAATFLMDGRF
jgi:hypothetical protein